MSSQPRYKLFSGNELLFGLDWDPATAGAVNDLVPHLDVDAIEEAVVSTYAGYANLRHAEFSSLQP